MKVLNGVKIAMTNKALCYKMLLCRVVVYGLLLFPLILFLSMAFGPFFVGETFTNLLDSTRMVLKNFILMETIDGTAYKENVFNVVSSLFTYVFSIKSTLLIYFICGLLIYQLIKFLSSVCDYVFAVNISEHMSSIHHQGFFTTLLENFFKACKYAGYRTVVLLFYNLISIAVCVLVFYLTVQPLGIYSITLTLLCVLIFASLRLTFSGKVLPKVVCEGKGSFESFFKAFKEFEIKSFVSRFMSYLTITLFIFTLSFACSLLTFNVAIIVTYPISTISFIAIRFVDYYTYSCKKYYVSFDEIVDPKELRTNDENLLNKVDI